MACGGLLMGSAGLLFGTGGAIFDGIAAFSEGGEATETMEMFAQAFNVQALLNRRRRRIHRRVRSVHALA